MDAQTLYNFSPWARLLGGGALLSSLPLAWIWFRYRDAPHLRRRLALTLLTLFLTFDLVMVGAFTRLTDSGLGCPDWPGCYGHATPLGASAHITDAQNAMPTGPVTHQKAWIEMLHRYLAMAVGALIVVLTAWAWRDRWQSSRGGAALQPISPWWASATLLWVCLQGLFGALTVTMKLFPAIVTLHLLGAYGLLALLVLQAVLWTRRLPDTSAPEVVDGPEGQRLRWLMVLCLAVVVLQATLGAWVSTNYAVLACSDIPRCQGQWWPAMDFAAGFEIWRPLGSSADGAVLSYQALTAIHMVHRLFALVVCVVLGWAYWRLRDVPALQTPRRYLGILLLAQVLTGLSNVVLDWPLAAAVLHTGGAGALVAVFTWLCVLTTPMAKNRETV